MMKNWSFLFLKPAIYLSLFFMLFYSAVCGQDTTSAVDTGCVQRDLPDVIREWRNKPAAEKKSENSLLLVPIIGSNPATGFMIGVGGQYAFKTPGSTLYSALNGSMQFTTKKQVLFMLKNNIYAKSNRIFYSGDWRYLIYSQATYGLGTNSPEGTALDFQYAVNGNEVSTDSLLQPMNYNYTKIHQSVSFRIKTNLYAGFGYYFDYYNNIDDEKLSLEPGNITITSHYTYNKYYGFDIDHYYSSALNVNLLYDSRDNMINPYKGYYFLMSYNGAFKLVGNKTNSSFLELEYRSFHGLSKKNPRHVISFWVLGSFSPAGEFPYMLLPATGYDQRGRSGRGYTQGRFRGNNMVYVESEYRFPLSKCGGIWGGVLFVNLTTTDNAVQDLELGESVKPGFGLGVRLMIDKHSRTNLTMDLAAGEKSSGFYLSAGETY